MSPAETDPWARSSDAFSAASDQLVTALKALAYALAALAEGSMMASFAGLTLLWHHICALGSSAYIEAVSRVGEASVLAQPELPVLIMFLITLAVLYTCILCCCGLRQCGLARFVLVHLLVLPSLAAMLAVPDAHVAVISATRSVVTALREHPHTAPAISTCEVVLAHPLAMSTASAAVSAYGSTYEALVAVAANGVSYPQVQAALSHPHVQTALQHPHVATVVAALEPHLQAMMGHSHFATVAGVWQVLLLASLGWWLLSLCACRRGGKSLGGKPQTRATRAAASDLALAAQAASRKKPKGGSKKGGNGGGGRLRGAGEGELLSDEELRAQVPSALELLFSPIIGAYRLTRSAVTLLTTRAEPPPTKAGRGRGAMHAAALAAADEGSGDGEMHAADASGPPSGAQRLPTSGAGRPKSGGGAEAVPVPARLLTTLKGLRVGEMVTSAALSQDGQLAAAVCTDRTLRIFSGLHHAGGERAILPTPLIGNIPLDHGTACSLSSNGRNVLVGTCQSRHVLAYTVTPPGGKAKAGIAFRKEWPQGAREAAHGTPMRAVLLAPNSKFVVTVDERTVKLWSPLSGELVSSVETKQAEQYGASISADSRLVAIAAASSPGGTRKVAPRHGQVAVHEVAMAGDQPSGLRQVLNVAGHTKGITSVAFAQDCVHLALASRDAEWSVVCTDVRYDLKVEATEHARGPCPGGRPFELVALSPFAKRLVGAAGGTLHIISVEHAARAAQPAAILIDSMPSAHGVVTALVYSCDGRRVLSAGEDGKLRLWRVAEDGEAGTI